MQTASKLCAYVTNEQDDNVTEYEDDFFSLFEEANIIFALRKKTNRTGPPFFCKVINR